MHRLFTLVIFFCLIICCTSEDENTVDTQIINHIVLLFDHPPVNYKYTFESGAYTVNSEKHEISFFDDLGHIHKCTLNHDQVGDTIIINTRRDIVEVGHAYNGLEKWYYLFQNGDSVVFSYDGLIPKAKVLNRSVSEFEINYDLERKQFLDKGDFSELAKYKYAFFLSGVDYKSENARNKIYQYQRDMYEMAKRKHRTERIVLDSLVAVGQISEKNLHYITSRSEIELKVIELNLKLDKLSGKTWHEKDLVFDERIRVEGLSNQSSRPDSSYYYHSYHQLLDILLFKYFYKKANTINSSLVVDGTQQAGGSNPDFKQVYDSIQTSKLLGEQEKKYLLMKCIESIMKQSDFDSRLEYFKKFKLDAQDTVFNEYLRSKYWLDDRRVYDIKLVSICGDTIIYDKLIHDQLGKVVYLDFWASWCRPCLKEMPASTALSNHYMDQEISFLYISTDRDSKAWELASEKYQLDQNNYRIINTHSSTQWEDMKINYIPTYMIFEKNGDVSNRYAPRPSDRKLISLLDKTLSL